MTKNRNQKLPEKQAVILFEHGIGNNRHWGTFKGIISPNIDNESKMIDISLIAATFGGKDNLLETCLDGIQRDLEEGNLVVVYSVPATTCEMCLKTSPLHVDPKMECSERIAVDKIEYHDIMNVHTRSRGRFISYENHQVARKCSCVDSALVAIAKHIEIMVTDYRKLQLELSMKQKN